mgnify:CR=1 FL=1
MTEEIVRRYAAGQSIRDIAWALSLSYARVVTALRASDVTPRGKKRFPPIAYGKMLSKSPRPYAR